MEGQEYEAAEMDGAILVANKRHTKIFLIESKKQLSGGVASARRQLQELIDRKIQVAGPFVKGIEKIVEIHNKGAFLPIKLP